MCICLCLFISCNDDETEDNLAAELVGLWTAISQTDSECDDSSDNISEELECTSESCLTAEFREDRTGRTVALEPGFPDLTEEFTYTVQGSTLIITINDSGDIFNFESTFSISGNTLTIVEGPGEFDSCNTTSVFTRS